VRAAWRIAVDVLRSSMPEDLPVLYVKTGCPWCDEARDFLVGHGISHRELNVTDDRAAFGEMTRISGQSKAPTLNWHGKVLADFGVEELVDFLHEHDVVLEDS
jgi:glutaredoxin 3